jgi:hypothetical protein
MQFDWPIGEKELKLWRLTKIGRRFFGKLGVPIPFGPTYIGEKGRTLGKNIWDSSEVVLGTALGNILGTHWVFEGNMLGTHWVFEGNMLGTKEK